LFPAVTSPASTHQWFTPVILSRILYLLTISVRRRFMGTPDGFTLHLAVVPMTGPQTARTGFLHPERFFRRFSGASEVKRTALAPDCRQSVPVQSGSRA